MANTRVNWNRFFAYKNMPKRSVWIGICRICGKDVCRPNWGTSGMKDHMERKHPNELQGAAGPVSCSFHYPSESQRQ